MLTEIAGAGAFPQDQFYIFPRIKMLFPEIYDEFSRDYIVQSREKIKTVSGYARFSPMLCHAPDDGSLPCSLLCSHKESEEKHSNSLAVRNFCLIFASSLVSPAVGKRAVLYMRKTFSNVCRCALRISQIPKPQQTDDNETSAVVRIYIPY